jgi:hypothetical protein
MNGGLTNRPRYRLELEVLPDAVPPAIRLRHVLKRALRDYRLRAVSVEMVAPAASGPAEATASPPRPPDASAAR